nr:hypothetical protein [Candidatus Nanopelagicales bacterium]
GGPHHRSRAAAWVRDTDAMVTAEFAVGLLAVIPVLLGLVGLTAAGVMAVQGQEAARVGARLLARGESPVSVQAHLHSALPDAQVSIETQAGMVHVLVRQTVGGFGLVPEFAITGRAVTPAEDE